MLTSVSNRAEDIQETRSRTPERGGGQMSVERQGRGGSGLSTHKADRKVRAEVREKKTE